jgi:hypothetical protein
MSTKSGVMYRKALQFKKLVSELSIKHYCHEDDQKTYIQIVDGIFHGIFRDEVDGEDIILCSDSSPCEYQTNGDGEPIDDDN